MREMRKSNDPIFLYTLETTVQAVSHHFPSHSISFNLPDHNTLVCVEGLHVVVAVVPDSEDVGRQFAEFLALVLPDLVHGVNVKVFVWVHCHKDGTSECLKWQRTMRVGKYII